ncbi:hypothetical protein B7494_g2242 [Chlorociboria aeruginascens]|nr:hypothetical protein B7494_g2242 [Chlorociboria aeruginascens]
MSTIRATSQSFSSWNRGTFHYLRRPFSTRSLVAIHYPSSSRSHPLTLPTTQNHPQKLYRSRHIPHVIPSRRNFTATAAAAHNDVHVPKPGEELHVTFIDKEGDEHKFAVQKGDNLLDIAQNYDIEMEGACGGGCACSTCHVIIEDNAMYDKMDEPDDNENDMLDLAFGLTETSRLGCQVVMSKELDGLRVRLPPMTRNLQASDFRKKDGKSG